MPENKMITILEKQRKFFSSGKTLDINFRIDSLKKLKAVLIKNESQITDALSSDLKKPLFESYISEISVIINDLNHTIKNVKRWARREKASSTLIVFPSKSYIYKEPYGVSLILCPWNYPFQLTFSPLIGAIAAGNCCVVKPSEISDSSSRIIKNIITEAFDEEFVSVFEGDAQVSKFLLEQRFDKIFFTGSPSVGKYVMEKASKHLSSVTLELGGKSPCIVHKDADVFKSAKRILWGKLINCGQTCVAPDYLIVHKDIKESLYRSFKEILNEFYSGQVQKSKDYTHIINKNHFSRLKGYLKDGKTIIGGEFNEEELFISPTIIEISNTNIPLMENEIFGPILPVLEYSNPHEISDIIAKNPDPLALYVFSKDKDLTDDLIKKIPFGGGCINDTIVHLANINLPFGGRGNSGIGSYHGKKSFDTFTHSKSILKRGFGFSLPILYPPYKDKHNSLRKFFIR